MSAKLLELVESFERCEVPREAWNHRAHLAYALVRLLEDPEAGGDRVREGILRYNAALGIPQTLTGGYHESITRFYIAVVRQFITETDTTRPLDVLLDDLVQQYGSPDFPFRYYTRDRLMSWKARTEWVEPDLKPLGPE